MTDNIVSFEKGGVKVVKDANTKLLLLVGNETLDKTLHNAIDNTDYQVPSGKKFTIIYIEDSAQMNVVTEGLYYADAADSATGQVWLRQFAAGKATNETFISAEVPALKYVNYYQSTSGYVKVWGIEESA